MGSEVKKPNWQLAALILIVIMGVFLRLNRLGEDSFWTDEAGQAEVILEPSFSKMVEGIKSHAMAMPMDYFTAWLTSRFSTSEFAFRLPAAIWGGLAVVVLFGLSRKIVNVQTALLATLILSINPLHIRYSQELRFYSALFFFCLLSNYLLLEILENEDHRWRRMAAYILATGFGAYYHPYVLLSIVNGLFILLLMKAPRKKFLRLLGNLFIAGFLTGVLFLPGYLIFGSEQTYNFDLLQWHRSFWHAASAGLGWSTFRYTQSTPNMGGWEWLNLIFSGIGLMFVVLRSKKNAKVLAFVLGTIVQIGLIILADLYKGYWFGSRQVLHLLPIVIILAAIGIESLLSLVKRLTFFSEKNTKILFAALYGIAVIVVVILGGIRVADYYEWQKSTGEQVVAELLEIHQVGQPVYVIPGYDQKVFRFYLREIGADQHIPDLIPISWDKLPEVSSNSIEPFFLATRGKVNREQKALLAELDYRSYTDVEGIWYGAHALYTNQLP